jgi:hypothetical protein
VNILAGIGKWMDMNGESIRGSLRTTLPVQYWGESTRKGNILYLQVFDWPKDGIIELGGYKGKVKKAWLLSDKRQSALPHKRANGMTVNIKVPLQAPDKSCSVIAVKVDDAEKTSTHRLLSGKRLNTLRALDGIAIGDKLQFGDGKATRNTVWGWEDKDQKLTWPVYLNESGKYSVSLEYKVKKASNGYRIKVGEAELRSGTTGEESQFVKQEIGRIVIPEGMHILEISPVDNPSDDFMELRAIYLKPIE